MGVAVRRYIDILIISNYYFSLLHLYMCNIANVAQEYSRSFKSRDHPNIINYIDEKH